MSFNDKNTIQIKHFEKCLAASPAKKAKLLHSFKWGNINNTHVSVRFHFIAMVLKTREEENYIKSYIYIFKLTE